MSEQELLQKARYYRSYARRVRQAAAEETGTMKQKLEQYALKLESQAEGCERQVAGGDSSPQFPRT